jgi:menaquinone-dependent protoporphyrinogen oxidase
MNSAKRRATAVFGALVAMAGFEHGLGETLQGGVRPSKWMFPSWPDVPALDPVAGEPAMTLIPNLLIAGLATMAVSSAFLIVVLTRLGGGRTPVTLAFLSVALLLVGGGFFPPLFGLAVAAAATRLPAVGPAVGPASGERRGSGVLVAYASKYGATQQIAEAVAGVLRDRDRVVDVLPCREVDDTSGYHAVVLGTALYLGSPMNDADRFLERNRRALASRPVAVFVSGPIGPVDDTARQQLRHALNQHPWLTPTTTTVFGGRFDPAVLKGKERLLTALPASPLHALGARDARDWDAIHQWADELAPALD